MDVSVNITVAAITASILVLCLAYVKSAHGYPYGARSLQSVEFIGVDADMCEFDIADQVNQKGFQVTDRRSVSDAVLEVQVKTNGGSWDRNGIEGAHYSAMLVGSADRVLFATGGYEEAHDLDALCEDIGDEISDDLEDSLRS